MPKTAIPKTTNLTKSQRTWLNSQAKLFVKLNIDKNATAKSEKKVRKDVYEFCIENKLTETSLQVVLDGKKSEIGLAVERSSRSTVDVRKLQKLLTLDQLLDLVSVSKKALSDSGFLDDETIDSITETVEGNENVTLKLL